MTQEIELCPFCGGKANYERNDKYSGYWTDGIICQKILHEYWVIYCDNCEAKAGWGTKDDALKVWNRREGLMRK